MYIYIYNYYFFFLYKYNLSKKKIILLPVEVTATKFNIFDSSGKIVCIEIIWKFFGSTNSEEISEVCLHRSVNLNNLWKSFIFSPK